MSDRQPLLVDIVPAPRLERYRQLVGDDRDALERTYRWSSALALALFSDVGNVEVTLRSAMATQLRAQFGDRWYAQNELFDDTSARSISDAREKIGFGRLEADGADSERLHGKLVASLMLGFWVHLLGRGKYAKRLSPPRRQIYHETLWIPALQHAFPGSERRRDVESAARVMQELRNRIAHHEHVIWGIPLASQKTRLRVSETHARVLQLADYLGSDVRAAIMAASTVEDQLNYCPVDRRALRL